MKKKGRVFAKMELNSIIARNYLFDMIDRLLAFLADRPNL